MDETLQRYRNVVRVVIAYYDFLWKKRKHHNFKPLYILHDMSFVHTHFWCIVIGIEICEFNFLHTFLTTEQSICHLHPKTRYLHAEFLYSIRNMSSHIESIDQVSQKARTNDFATWAEKRRLVICMATTISGWGIATNRLHYSIVYVIFRISFFFAMNLNWMIIMYVGFYSRHQKITFLFRQSKYFSHLFGLA